MLRRPHLLAALTLACGPAPATGTSSSAATTTDSTTTAATTTELTATTSDSDPTDITHADSFMREPDIFSYNACHPFMQDCPPGQKCAPYSFVGDTRWDATKCIDVTGTQQPGDSCISPVGGLDGVDDCALGAFCWDVDLQTHQGICVAQCSGSRAAPICPENTACALADDVDLALCLPPCHPLTGDCPANQVCAPFQGHGSFACLTDASGDEGQTNDPCAAPNACDPGLACLAPATAASACDLRATGCCQPYCQLPDGPCPGPEQQCIPWYGPFDPIPPGNEDIGICAITH